VIEERRMGRRGQRDVRGALREHLAGCSRCKETAPTVDSREDDLGDRRGEQRELESAAVSRLAGLRQKTAPVHGKGQELPQEVSRDRAARRGLYCKAGQDRGELRGGRAEQGTRHAARQIDGVAIAEALA
jgi:hypothetical protein